MATTNDDIMAKFRGMSDGEKLKFVDSILKQLDKPTSEIDKPWVEEARKRWKAYKEAKLKALSSTQPMKKYR